MRCGHLISRCLPPHILHKSSTSLSLDEDEELGEPPPSSFLVRSKTGKEGGKTLAPGCGGGGCVDDAATFAAGFGYPAGIGAQAQGFGHALGTSIIRPGGGAGVMRNGMGTHAQAVVVREDIQSVLMTIPGLTSLSFDQVHAQGQQHTLSPVTQV